MATIATMLVLDGYLELRRERRLVQSEMGDYARLMGRSLRGPIADIWNERGMKRALELIDDVNEEEAAVAVRWVWLDADPSDALAPRAPRSALAGLDAEGVSVALEDAQGAQLASYVSVNVPGERPGALELSESLDKRDARTATRIERLSILLGGLLAVSAATIFLLGVRLVGRPLAQLAAKAQRVGRGDLTGPLELKGAAELGDLARALNRMCEDLAAARRLLEAEIGQKLQALDQLRHANRLKTVGRLASGIAHELGTPLNVVSGRASLIQRGTMSQGEVEESASIIRSQVDRMTQIVRQLLDFARRRSSEKRVLDLGQLATSTCEMVAPAAKKHDVALEVLYEKAKPLRVRGNESEIQQVISNLLMNSIQSMPNGGTARVEVTCGRASHADAAVGQETTYLRAVVSDQGEGIPEEDLPHVFEPFFTTKDVGAGTGLGLSIVHGIIEDHQGWIQVESEIGKGSRFTFYLPKEEA